MINIAIVEDDSQYIATLKEYIARFMKENGVSIELKIFTDGKQIVFDYEPVYDIILMDIEMPGLNGMSVAEKIRETMKNMEEKLAEYYFERCNVSYLVNLAHVNGIVGDNVDVEGEQLPISRQKRKGFVSALSTYVGGGNNAR